MPEIALETLTSGKYVARLLNNAGFSVHMADPKDTALTFKSEKKNHRVNS